MTFFVQAVCILTFILMHRRLFLNEHVSSFLHASMLAQVNDTCVTTLPLEECLTVLDALDAGPVSLLVQRTM